MAGLRGDAVFFPVTDPDGRYNNKYVPNLTFRDGVKLKTDRFPEFTLLASPRLGFNWDVQEKGITQVRGGTGIFSGRVPYVWLSNQLSNNGVLFNSASTPNPTNRPFTANVDTYRPAVDPSKVLPTSYNLAVTDENFKFPQVWRSNLAVAQNFGEGWILEVEGLYTKDLNAVYHQNVNLPASTVKLIGTDNRPIYFNLGPNGFPTSVNNRIYGARTAAQGGNTVDNPNISDAILMKNTSEGYSAVATFQLTKKFKNGILGAAYNYTDSRSVNDGGSIAQSIWRDRSISGDPNANVTSYASFMLKNRVIAYGSYRLGYLKERMATTLGFSFSHASGGRFTYGYAGDLNGDGQTANDLLFVPSTQSDILLTDITRGDASKYTAAQQWTDLDNYIKQDEYLNSRRGQYVERNGGVLPNVGTLDLKIVQDFNFKAGGKINTLQLTFDIFNFTNMLNSEWGVDNFVTRPALLTFTNNATGSGFDTATGKPKFTFPEFGGKALSSTFQPSTFLGSRWSGQIGVRYIFN